MDIEPSSAADRRGSSAGPVRAAAIVMVVGVAAAVIGFPLFDLGRELAAAGSTALRPVLASGDTWGPVANTVWTALVVTAVTLVGATAVALSTVGLTRSRRLVVVGVMAAPLLIPPFVSALSWVAAYGRGGLIDDVIGLSASWVIGPIGVVTVLTVSAMPIAYLVVLSALDTRQERDLVRAARISGATAARAFWTVTVPLLRPALVASGAITFIMSANAFGVPAVLGSPAGFATVTTRLYRDLVRSAAPAAFDRVLVLAAVLGVLALVAVIAADRPGVGRIRLRVEASGPADAVRRAPRALVWGLGAYATVTLVVPTLALVATALSRSVGLAPAPSNWTLDNFAEAMGSGTPAALRTSLILAVLAATIVVALGGLLVAVERHRRYGLGTITALAFAVPGSVLAVAVLLAYGPWLRDTVLLILIAYVAKFWALGHRPIAGSAQAMSPELTGAARVAGATPSVAARTITLPIMRSALVAGWMIVFMFAVHELTISSLLYGPGNETLAVAVLDLGQLGDPTVTAALAVLLTVGAAIAVAPLGWLLRGRSGSLR